MRISLASWQELWSKYEIIQSLVFTEDDFLVRAFPFLIALVHVEDIIADFHDTVHVMGIDHSSDIIFDRNLFNEFVDDEGGLRIEPWIRVRRKKDIWDWVQSPGPGPPFFSFHHLIQPEISGSHQAGWPGWVPHSRGPVLVGPVGKHTQGKHDILFHVLTVE